MPSESKRFFHRYFRVFLFTVITTAAINNAIAQSPKTFLRHYGFVEPIGTLVQTWNPNLVNQYLEKWDSHIIPGITDPFDTRYPVSEITPTSSMYFVRAYTGPDSGALGSFIVRASVIRGMSPAQIRDILALPDVPTKLAYVKVPAGPQYGLWSGIAAPIMSPGYEWGTGGGEQTKIIGKETNSSPPADPARFANYSRLPANSYMNAQYIGNSALSYSRGVSSGSAGRVAAYLDNHIPEAYSDMEDVYTTLDFINSDGPPQLAVALKQISPISFDSYSTVFFRNDLLFGKVLFEHTQVGNENLSIKTLQNGISQVSGARTKKSCFASWVNAAGEHGEQTQGFNREGFYYQTGALSGGVDCQISSNLTIGAGAGYFRDHLGWNVSAGNADINNAKLGIYSNYSLSDYFLNSALTGGFSWSTAQRNMNFSGVGTAVLTGAVVDTLSVNRSASSDQVGQNIGLHFSGGKNFQFTEWNLMPNAQISYFNSRQGSFTESGASDLNLHVQDYTAQTLRTQLAIMLGKIFNTKQGSVVRANVQLGWAHNFILDNRSITASLPAIGGEFNVNGYKKETNELLASTALSTKVTKKFWVDAQYNADLSHGFNSQAISFIFKYYLDV